MERTTTKHGPRTDEALARETASLTRGAPVESHAEEFLMAEPAGEGDPEATAVLHALGEPIMGMPPDEIMARSELAMALRPGAFPADAPTLLRAAIDDEAPELVCETLRRVDQVTRYVNVQQLWEATGGHRELRSLPHEPVEPEPAPAPPRRRAKQTPARGPAVEPVAAKVPANVRAIDDTELEPMGEADESYLAVIFGFARASWKLASRTTRLAFAPARAVLNLRRGASD